MTNAQVIYDAFLSKQLDDEWENWDMEEINDKLKTEKAKYDFHRQMSLMAVEILKKSSTFSKKK